MKQTICIAAVLVAVITSASAKLGAFGLDEMIRAADIIVVGKVQSVSPGTGTPTCATIRVTEVLKGSPGETIELNVQRTWTCDASEAKKGEQVLLFVSHDQRTGQNLIYASGRGRMPIDEVKGKSYATFLPEVRMAKGIEIINSPDPQFGFIRRANLIDLKTYIAKILKETPNKVPEATQSSENRERVLVNN